MDIGGGPPLKQHQDFGIQDLWSPVTPVKNIPTRRQLVPSPCYNQRNHVSEMSWLDPLSGVQAATPPWGFSFQNVVCSTAGLPDLRQGLNSSQAVAEASTNRAAIGNFMPHSATISSGKAVLMSSWSPKLGKMRPLTPFFEKNGNCRVMPASSNQLLINGKVLVPQGCCNRSSDWVGQKVQYGSTVSQLPNLNPFPESTMSFPVTREMPILLNHMNPEIYSQRMQYKQQSAEVINVVDEQAREQNLLMKVMPAEASFSNLMSSAEYAYLQNPNCSKDLAVLSDEVSYQQTGMERSLVEREKEGIDLDDASKQKPKKKKHRPKVIIEGKPARTPKPGTPKPKTPKAAQNTENASGKRKYTRRKKDSTPCSDPNALGEIVDAESQTGPKSVRRSLNFDLVESQTEEKFSHFLSMFMQNLENHEPDPCQDNNLVNSRLKETVDPTVVQGPIVENSLSGIVFDLRSSTSEPQNEYLKILQSLPSAAVSQNVEASKNIVNSNRVFDTPPTGKKRDRCPTDEVPGLAETNLMPSYDDADFSYKNHDAEMLGPYLPEINKRMRMENGCNGTCNPSPILTYTPSTGWKAIQVSNNSHELTFNDTMKLMAQERLQTLERVLLREEADVNTQNYPILSNNLRSLIGLMDYNRNSTPVKPSLQKNNDIRQPPTPEKPIGYSNSQESKICETLLQFGTSEDVNKPVKVKGRRGRKKREENPPINPCPSPSSIVASHCEISPQKTIKTSTPLHGKSLHHEVISCSHQDTSNYKASTNSSIPSLSPYIDFMDHIVQQLRRLSLNGEHEVVSSQVQNAIVPYVRNGGAMVPYEGTFELTKRRRPRAKVDLDPETNRVWKLLMGIEGEQNEGASVDKEIWWEEERCIFRGRVDSFIARMHLVQGDRRFSQWKGSVVDSVIGVFLTQNVSDHLSSSAFMALAAKFPLQSGGHARGFNAEKVNTPSENQTECITSLTDTSNLQSNVIDHAFYSQASSEINATQNDGKKENSNSNETFESGTGCNSVVYYAGKTLESHETELSFGQESPNSESNTAVTVARSINSVETEDRRLVEEVVSSQNSGISSDNSVQSQVLSSDHTNSSSMLNIEEDDLLIRNLNNGFGRSSFTELLHMAESNKFQELYSHDSMPNANSQVIDMIGNNLPVLDHMDSTKGTCQPYQADFTPHHTLFGLSDMLPDADSFYSRNPSNLMISENNAYTLKEEIRSSLQSTVCEIVSGDKFDVNHGDCIEPAVANLTASDGLNKLLLTSGTARSVDSHMPIRISNAEQSSILEKEIGFYQQPFSHNKLGEGTDVSSNISHGLSNIQAHDMARSQQKDGHSTFKAEISQEAIRTENQMGNYTNAKTSSTSNIEVQNKLDVGQTCRSNMKDEAYNVQNVSSETSKQGEKSKRRRAESAKKTFDWDSLRKEVNSTKPTGERSSGAMDSLDWEAVRCASVSEIAETIRERGMNNMLAERIKDFLNRLVREHGSIDLEWLRDVPSDKSKDFLLSIRGLGLKSAECVRLLTLHHLAFPVDTNVGRICVRLGWVPLQPLPESLQLHLLEMYPVLETIQKYLWPRLCKLDQRTLYELHYQMITFGKVFCTKSKPNCNACPMRGECRHFASAFASARLALPAPEDKSIVSSTHPIAADHGMAPAFTSSSILQLECSTPSQDLTTQKSCEPIIEEPATPEPETLESEIEDAFFEDPDEIPTIKLNFEKFTQNLQNYMHENMEVQAADMSKALVALTPEAASIPMPKLKNISRLRTEHQVYELPDSHPLLEGLDQREADDPSPYLLAIWTPGETAQSTEPPTACCDSQDTGQLCDRSTCSACSSVRESQAHKVRGTLLIPCRTAMRGSFPLNGTYFQVNEVFADHHTSRNPIDIPRDWIWNLSRRTVCFGTSIPTIFRGLTTEGIQQCFWRGFVCVRGFDRVTRAPKPLYARLHFPASKAPKNGRGAAAAAAKAAAVAADEHSNNTSDLTGIHH